MTLHSPLPAANIVPLFPQSPTKPAQIAIVVPCFNEARRLDLPTVSSFLLQTPEVRLVFVNDGSSDETLSVLSLLHAAHPAQVEVLSLSRNSGKAEAVRQGLLYAAHGESAFLGYWDADLATPLDAITDFARVAHRYTEVEVVYGARLPLLGHRVNRTLPRRIISRICARLARIAVGLPIGDTQCGAKLLRNTPRLAQSLVRPFSAGWLFDVELFSRIAETAACPARAFYEYPLPEWTEVPGSKITGRAIRRAGLAMLRLIAERRLGLAQRAPAADLPSLIVQPLPNVPVDKAA